MKYSNDTTKAAYDALPENLALNYLFFWGHTQTPSAAHIHKSCLSQWYPSSFEFLGIDFPTAEHRMMYCKANLFYHSDNHKLANMILKAETPAEAKKLGRLVKNFDQQKWDEHKYHIVFLANMLKFSQNLNLKGFLLSTGDRIIVEASPYDTIWGIGMKESDPGVMNPYNWKGENLLGYALMEVRDFLRDAQSA